MLKVEEHYNPTGAGADAGSHEIPDKSKRKTIAQVLHKQQIRVLGVSESELVLQTIGNGTKIFISGTDDGRLYFEYEYEETRTVTEIKREILTAR